MSSPKKSFRLEFRPQFRHRKSKGDFAEMAFMVKGTTLGLTLCKPYGENHRYDFLVDVSPRRVLRVQVKSSWTRRYGGVYQFKTSGSGRPYRRGEIHYLVVYVVPVDAWYVIPARAVRGRDMGVVFPDTPHSRGQFEKYREAWHLILGRKRSARVDLMACADTEYCPPPFHHRGTEEIIGLDEPVGAGRSFQSPLKGL